MRFRAAVLVIDDEPGMREMLSYELAQEGFEVETAESGMAAVEAVKRRRFDLAVTDLKMPGMDGVATVEALRSLDPDLEVIVGTGYATVETAVACMKRGAYDYIQKPYDLTELKVLLERAMQKSHLQGAVALYEASRALLATLKHAELVQLVVGLAHRVLRADDAGLVLWEGTGELALHRSTTSPLHDGVFVELARAVATSGGPMAVSEANLLAGRIHTDGAPLPTMALPDAGSDAGLQSALVYPLVGKERHLGALVLLRREGSPAFAQTELQRGAVFANQLTLSLDNARLFEALERKVQELVDTQEQLLRAEKLALAGHLAGAVAHEINNPLTFVRVNLDALRDYSSTVGALWLAAKGAALYLRELPAPEAAGHAGRLQGVGGSQEQTETLIRDIAEITDETLDGVRRISELVAGFGRLADPADPGPPERIGVAALLEECLQMLPSALARRCSAYAVSRANVAVRGLRARPEGGRMEVGQTHVDCETRACREDLRSAFLNILVSFCSGNHRVARPDTALELRVEDRGGHPVVVLDDRELQLSPEARLRLFDPRVEVDQGRTMRLNISLALAHQLLSRNGARVSVESDESGGTRCSILLPSVEA